MNGRVKVINTACRSSSWLGAFGAVVGCSGLIVASLAGSAGAAVAGAAHGSSMAGMEISSSNPGWVNAINTAGQPLLIVSLLFIVAGMLSRGPFPVLLAAAGSVLFYGFMYIYYSVPLAVVAALVIACAYVVAFWSRRNGAPVASPSARPLGRT